MQRLRTTKFDSETNHVVRQELFDVSIKQRRSISEALFIIIFLET